MGKGEVARYEQFLLFPLCFQKACFPWASKGVIVWEWVEELQDTKYNSIHYQKVYNKDQTIIIVHFIRNQHSSLNFDPLTLEGKGEKEEGCWILSLS